MIDPIQLLLTSPWFWIVLILLILIVAFRAQIARLIDRTQKAKAEAGQEGAKIELEAPIPAPEKPPAAASPPPATPPAQSVQVGQGAVMNHATFGDIGNVIVKPSTGSWPAQAEPPGDKPDRGLASGWSTAAIRELLTAAFSDDELTTLCFDHFRPVYQEFSTGMSLGQKIQRLLDYGERYQQVEKLLAIVRERNPAQYARFERRLIERGAKAAAPRDPSPSG